MKTSEELAREPTVEPGYFKYIRGVNCSVNVSYKLLHVDNLNSSIN
jgi:hypothetical protein